MKFLATTGFVLVGLINLAPVVGVLGVSQLARLYAVDIAHNDIALLLMHRAVLLGIVGALLVAAGFIPSLRNAAVIAGAISMGVYVLLVFVGGVDNTHLVKIAWIDVGALGVLGIAGLLHLKSS
ncbi:MAG: hypothetical protein AB8B96_11235 [Lysobacterales bacterium]